MNQRPHSSGRELRFFETVGVKADTSGDGCHGVVKR